MGERHALPHHRIKSCIIEVLSGAPAANDFGEECIFSASYYRRHNLQAVRKLF
jgi:hypothetical protein